MIRSAVQIACAFTSLWAVEAHAQVTQPTSNFGCSGLQENGELSAIEGRDGVFYRINADLRMHHPFSDQTVESLADLSKALAANGTTLIFVPIPTKSVTMPDHLPDNAALYGFDLDVATHVHLDILQRLTNAGVTVVDARAAMLETPEGQLPFFKADFHWSAAGARETARAIANTIRALPDYPDMTKSQFETTAQETSVAFSGMRRILQKSCLTTLPEAVSITYETTQNQSLDLGEGGFDLFGGGTDTIPVALLGTSFSDSPINNFPGFLAEYSELEVINYAMTGGNQFGAMTSYLTSPAFESSPPKVLVWENPIYNNLAQYGDAPMRELIAAAGRTCLIEMPTEVEGASVAVDLTGYNLSAEDTIFIDTQRNIDARAEFAFGSSTGFERVKTIERGERLDRTGRFYMPLSGLWDDGAATLRIDLEHPLPIAPTVYLCPKFTKDES
ncbi:MAG: hypothetical protein ABJN34_03640 [Litoreibacter sp.]|uniref:alginate O-acetyltransferase AlgX-related protein n=1 Tax=Litoreibacter sp. TaxID=1969459 RepID=UPI003299228A